MMSPRVSLLFLALFHNFVWVLCNDAKLRWVPMETFSEEIAVPAGYEDNAATGTFINTYVVQFTHQGGMLLGKYSKEVGKCLAEYKDGVVEAELSKCKFLAFPLGTMSWLHANPQKLPEFTKLVKGGKTAQNQWYVCRALGREGDLLPGSLGHNDKKCHVAEGSTKIIHDKYEVLIPNLLGIRTEVSSGVEMLG